MTSDPKREDNERTTGTTASRFMSQGGRDLLSQRQVAAVCFENANDYNPHCPICKAQARFWNTTPASWSAPRCTYFSLFFPFFFVQPMSHLLVRLHALMTPPNGNKLLPTSVLGKNKNKLN